MGMEFKGRTWHEPCANCRKRPGYMYSSEWNHDAPVCSRACGQRLHKKIKNGMVEPRGLPNHWQYTSGKEERLRLRIKELSAKVRQPVRERVVHSKSCRRLKAEGSSQCRCGHGPFASSEGSPATELKTAVSKILSDALTGQDQQYRHNDSFIRWGLVENHIHEKIDELCR